MTSKLLGGGLLLEGGAQPGGVGLARYFHRFAIAVGAILLIGPLWAGLEAWAAPSPGLDKPTPVWACWRGDHLHGSRG